VPEAFQQSWTIDWFCSYLGLPLIEVKPGEVLHMNAAARDILGAGTFTSIAAALGPLLGATTDTATLQAAVQGARQGQPCELALADGLRALVTPGEGGRACVVLAPHGVLDGLALQRRALATDRSARVAHELANALGAIAGWARLAREGARVDEALELIEKSADDAWTAARVVLGEVSAAKAAPQTGQVIDLSDFTEETARLLLPKAIEQQVSIRSAIQPGLQVVGDRSSVWAILWNLVGNAIEALPPGGTVSLQLTEAAERVRLCIADDGPGMSSDVRARIFEPYFTTKHSGTGLGLALVKQAVAALGGHIDLDSELHKGTRFVVDLPHARAAAVHPRRFGKRESGVYVADMLEGRMLVIDDDKALREMIGTALQMRGAEVELAANLHDALKLRGPFQVVIVDYLLGDQRGDAALAALRAAGLVHAGLLVTGTDVPRKLAGGGEPDAVLRKPFELDELFERVGQLLASARHKRPSRTG
jgi:signal transduction histidine kinase/CheY-like chemotaxis protein